MGTEGEALRLNIPDPARGHHEPDRVRFVSAAGEMKKPALDEKVERVALMRKQLVRVLDDDGAAVGEWVPDLSTEQKLAGLRDMMLLRAFDARMLRAHRQGTISFYMQALGEEAIACAHQRALRPGDMHFPTYRQQGLLISGGYPLVDMMNQILSNRMDPLKGRQLPVLYSAKEYGYFSKYIRSVEFLTRDFRIEGEVPAYRWRLLGEESEFLGYVVQKAEAEHDGHTIEAWFTVDIPGFVAPETYSGLPGVVLMVSVDRGLTLIQAVEVDLDTPVDAISAPTDGESISPEDFDAIVEEKTEEFRQQMQGRLRRIGGGQ